MKNAIKKKISWLIDGIMWIFGVDATPPTPMDLPKVDDKWVEGFMRKCVADRVWYDHGGNNWPDNCEKGDRHGID